MKVRLLYPMLAGALLSGCAGLPGGGVSTDTFALTEPPVIDNVGPARNRQILIAEPIALRTLDGDQVMIRTSPSSIQFLSDSQWNDRLPRVIQAQLIEAFENTGQLAGVGRSGEGLAIDFQIVPTVRKFEVIAYGNPSAEVELSVKLLNDRNGVVRAQRVFTASAPLAGTRNEDYIVALDAAFDAIVTDMVPWAMQYF